jgi:hypothetical protein
MSRQVGTLRFAHPTVSAVIARESGQSSTHGSIDEDAEYWMPAFAGMTQ